MGKFIKYLSWLWAVGLLVLIQQSSTVLSKPMAPAFQFQITPFLSCVDVNETAQTLTAYFGYESFEADITQVPVGADNRFVPAPANRQQPILFFPGYHDKAFRVTVSLSGVLWIMNGFGVAAQTSSKACSPPPAPVIADIVPFVESVTVKSATGEATASFGYHNASSNTISIPAGSLQNRLSRAGNQTQPTQFLPGLQRNVFSTTFPATEALYWMVQGLPALAVPGGTLSCPPISIRAR